MEKESFFARCCETAGGSTPGRLLSQLCYWHPRMRLEFGGKKWIKRSREDLGIDTKLTPKQVKASLAKLRERGLITTEQHIFRGKPILHTRLTPKTIVALGPLK